MACLQVFHGTPDSSRKSPALCVVADVNAWCVCSRNDPGIDAHFGWYDRMHYVNHAVCMIKCLSKRIRSTPDSRPKQAASRSALLRCSLYLRGELMIRVRAATGDNAADRTEGELAHVGIRQLALGIKEVGARQTLRT